MSRHSQNATAKAFFTYAEKQKLSYGTRKKIIGGHSLKGFEMCSLCLQPVINPMSCQKGHLFCKKCILEYFLSQKKEKQKQIEEWKKQQKQIELEKKSSILSALDSEIYSFHKTECSALPKRKSNNFQDSNQKNPQIIVPLHKIPQTKENILQNDPVYLQSIEKKKKFDEIRKQDNQLKDKSKNDIKSFWVPSKTPKANDSIVKKPSENILCPEGGEPIRYKRLIEVNFTLVPKIEERDPNGVHSDRFQCACCAKTLTNSISCSVLSNCGHVFCKRCIDEIIKKDMKCNVCEKKIHKKREIIPLQKGGTSFAAHNSIESKKITPSAWV